MIVKELISELLKMPQEKTVCISTQASTNCLDIKNINDVGSWVELVVDDRDFELDEDGMYEIEQQQKEER